MKENPRQYRPEEERPKSTDPPQPQQGRQEGDIPDDNPSRLKRHKAVFDCVLPKSNEPPSLFCIQQMLRDGMLCIEEVPALEQQWMDYLKTMDRQGLEEKLMKSEAKWKDYKDMQKRKALTPHAKALIPLIDEEIEIIHIELRQRK